MKYKDSQIKSIHRYVSGAVDITLKNGKVVKLNKEEGKKEYKRLNDIK